MRGTEENGGVGGLGRGVGEKRPEVVWMHYMCRYMVGIWFLLHLEKY